MALNSTDLQILSRLLDQAMDLEAEQLDEWLAGLGPEHSYLLPHLREMLAEHVSKSQVKFMADGPRLADETIAKHGELVGPYRLIQEIGRGGMGTVWLAERADGSLKRHVALKLPRLAWGAGLSKRMARERDIGAMLEHPNIARLYDAGVDERGRPYLALEYIDGLPIDKWCEANGRDVRAKLLLFVQVARAVSYAHGRLVVHRDLKPSNVLVTPDGQAHLLDFGIAKLLDEAASEETSLTQQQGRVLTPQYASPEQVAGEPITVQSDVYSLGVLLYQLLTGTLPIVPKRRSPGAVEDAILLGDAPLASSRVKDRSTVKALRGEVDAILAKAMQREPTKRYATADALAQDIERCLRGETVAARPDNIAYRMRKAMRRHWIGISAAAAVLVSLLVGGGMAAVQALHAAQQMERARLATEFVTEMFRVSSRPSRLIEAHGGGTEAVLDQGAKLIEARFPSQPDIQAELYGVVGRIYADLGAGRQAIDYARRQLDSLDRLPVNRDRYVQALLLLADAHLQDDQSTKAEVHAKRAVELAEKGGELWLRAYALLATIQLANGKADESRVAALTALGSKSALDSAPSVGLALLLRVQANLLKLDNRFDEAAPLTEKAIEMAVRAEGAQSRTAIDLQIDHANDLLWVNRYADARPFIDAALASLRLSGNAGQVRAAVVAARYWVHLTQRNFVSMAEAIAVIEESRATIAAQGPGTPKVTQAEVDFLLGVTYADRGYLIQAEPLMIANFTLLRDSTDSLRKRLHTVKNMARLQLYTGRHTEAGLLFQEEFDLERSLGEGQLPRSVMSWFFASWNLVMQGEYDRATDLLSKSPKFGADPASTQGAYYSRAIQEARAVIRLERGDALGARAMMPDAAEMTPVDRYLNPWEPALFGEVDCAAGRPALGLPVLSGAIVRIEELVNNNDPELNRLRGTAGLCALAIGDRAQARRLAELARRGFNAQPDVGSYFKAPLFKLERALGLRLSPV